jgi:hypothetical protein
LSVGKPETTAKIAPAAEEMIRGWNIQISKNISHE